MTSRTALFRLLTAAAFITFAAGAHAQDVAAPDESQLNAPGASAAPTLEQPQDQGQAQAAAPQQQAAASSGMPEQPKTVQNDGPPATDPCPAPEAALNASPDDLAKVQEDIDRFTLCVQRAQLLERLNESVVKNVAAADAALGLQAPPGMAGAQRAGGMGLMPLPANALAGADVGPNIAQGRPVPSMPAPSSAPADNEAPAKAAEPEKPAMPWTIREIYSAGGGVEAKLVSPEGDEIRAKTGAKLPDGKTTVVRVTPAGVTIRDDKGVKPLDWVKS